jgi:hypothetical protein
MALAAVSGQITANSRKFVEDATVRKSHNVELSIRVKANVR